MRGWFVTEWHPYHLQKEITYAISFVFATENTALMNVSPK